MIQNRPCHTVQFSWQLAKYAILLLTNSDGNVYLPILATSIKSRIALQVARKIARCDRALIHVCLAYLFLHSGQVFSSFKCYFKRKYLNLIDSNCDVDEPCMPVVFYRDCSCHNPECIVNIYAILRRFDRKIWRRPRQTPKH